MAGLVLGADGGVGSTYNFFPKMIQRIMKNVSDGKINEAREEQLHVQQLARARNKFSKWSYMCNNLQGQGINSVSGHTCATICKGKE